MSEEFSHIKIDPRIDKEQIKYTKADFSFPHTKSSMSVYDKEGNCRGTVHANEEAEFRVIDNKIFKIDYSNINLAGQEGKEEDIAIFLEANEIVQRSMDHEFLMGKKKDTIQVRIGGVKPSDELMIKLPEYSGPESYLWRETKNVCEALVYTIIFGLFLMLPIAFIIMVMTIL